MLSFFTEDIVSDIVTETNRFASQVLDSHRAARRSRLRKWIPTNSEEISGNDYGNGISAETHSRALLVKKGYLRHSFHLQKHNKRSILPST